MPMAVKPALKLPNDEDFVRASREKPGYRFEREEDGTVIVSPTHTKSGAKSLEAAAQLRDYRKTAGGKAFDSNTGFSIGPGRALRCPDGAWVSQSRIDALTEEQSAEFWPLSPDVAIEVKSGTDSFKATVKAIERFIERGSRYAVAIDPSTREVVELGVPPSGLALDFDAIIDA